MESLPSLTRAEASERAALISVEHYAIDVDLTGMRQGPDFRAVSTVSFACGTPGASTFVDAALEVVSATFNGTPVPADQIGGARITLTDLAADNVLVVETVQTETAHGEYVRRSVDVSDGRVYVWTSFEPDDARRAWACFDQPDLKAPHAITVTAPAQWLVVSNSGDPRVEDVDGARRWAFPATPPLSTYVPVLAAGPFHEVRSTRGGHDLGLFARQSLAGLLERDAEDYFSVTAEGLAFFGERFGLEFPQHKYDQVFVPDMGGAMENYGCVAWSDSILFRGKPTHAEHEVRAQVLLHEMAHMWFGDMVTMRWWEDLWLNEAFAEWASHWAAEAATKYTDAWAGFLAGSKQGGYAADMAPTTHPIRQPVENVADAAASFDGITYPKGASVLKQLHAFLGEDAFVQGLREYFRKHAWGNTTLDDLMVELATASGRDLGGWVSGWLDMAGTDRLVLEAGGPAAGAGSTATGPVLRASGPDGAAARPHRVAIGLYDRDGDRLVRRRLETVETTGAETVLPDLGGAALALVNDDDLTFASVQPDAESVRVLVTSAGALPTAISRAVTVSTMWDLLVRGELPTADFVECAVGVLRVEPVDTVIESYLSRAVQAADVWSPDARRAALMTQVADAALLVAQDPARRQGAVRALARTATTSGQLDRLADLVGDDVDLRWHRLVRLAEVDLADPDEVKALLEADPDPDAWVRALAVDVARPDTVGKDAAWSAIVDDHKVPMGSMGVIASAFWRRSQASLVAPYADRFLALLPTLHHAGMIPSMSMSGALFPRAGVDESFADRADEAAGREDVSLIVARSVIGDTDRLRRVLRARQI